MTRSPQQPQSSRRLSATLTALTGVFTASLEADIRQGATPKDDLAALLEACRALTTTLSRESRLHKTTWLPYLLGTLSPADLLALDSILERLRAADPRTMSSVFTQPVPITSIEAAVWRAPDHDGRATHDALINMVFRKGCGELPLHTHPHSDRVVFVIRGRGYAYYSEQPPEKVQIDSIRKVAVQRGTVLCYDRDVVHTFGSTDSEIELLTYHSEFVPFDDERQCALTADAWTPAAAARAQHRPVPPKS